MADRCSVEWETDEQDEDGDGKAEHYCFYAEGHGGDYHWCAAHFACSPVYGAPVWFNEYADEDPGPAGSVS